MVLESLGYQISQSLAGLSQVSVIDEEVLDKVLKDIARALLTADVNFRIVGQMRDNIRKRVNVDKLAAGLNKEKIIHQAVNDELVAILDCGLEEGKGPKGELLCCFTLCILLYACPCMHTVAVRALG